MKWVKIINIISSKLSLIIIKRSIKLYLQSNLISSSSLATMYINKAQDKELRFMFLGDYGWRGKNLTEVGNQMSAWSVSNTITASFVVCLGDNFYHDGVKSVDDMQWNLTFHSTFHQESLINIPFYAILGNHDYHQVPQAEIDYYYLHKNSSIPIERRWVMPDHNYTAIYNFDNNTTLQVVFIDTSIIAVKETEETDINGKWEVSPETKMNHLKWIDETLRLSTADWLVVAGHYTIFSNAEHGDTQDLIDLLVPLLEKYNVNMYINGHDHTLQHISWHGVEYFTSGRGCETIEKDDNGKVITDYPWGSIGSEVSSANEASHFFSLSTGFSAAVVTKDTLKVSFIDHHGNTLYHSVLANPRSVSNVYESISFKSTTNYSTNTLYIVGAISVIIGIVIGMLMQLTIQQIRNKIYRSRNREPTSFFAAVDLTLPVKKVNNEENKKVKNPMIEYEMIKNNDDENHHNSNV